jgi:Glycosyltransferase family 87
MQALACAGMIYLCAAELRSWQRPARWLTAGALVFTSLPIWHCLKWGQVSLLVILCSVFALQRRSAWLLWRRASSSTPPASRSSTSHGSSCGPCCAPRWRRSRWA